MFAATGYELSNVRAITLLRRLFYWWWKRFVLASELHPLEDLLILLGDRDYL